MRHTSKLPMRLLPKVPGLRIENATIDVEAIPFTLTSTSLPVACPVCDQKTARVLVVNGPSAKFGA